MHARPEVNHSNGCIVADVPKLVLHLADVLPVDGDAEPAGEAPAEPELVVLRLLQLEVNDRGARRRRAQRVRGRVVEPRPGPNGPIGASDDRRWALVRHEHRVVACRLPPEPFDGRARRNRDGVDRAGGKVGTILGLTAVGEGVLVSEWYVCDQSDGRVRRALPDLVVAASPAKLVDRRRTTRNR